jgi:hypothetical protein
MATRSLKSIVYVPMQFVVSATEIPCMRASLDRVLSIAAILIAFGSAGVSYLQYSSGKHYAELAVRPYLSITPYLEGEGGQNGLYLSNDGNGPAVVTGVQIVFEGRTFDGPGESPWPIVERAIGAEGCFRRGWPVDAAVLRPGEKEVVLAPTRATNLPQCIGATVKLLTHGNLRLVIRYSDLDGAPFVLDYPVRVNDPDIVRLGSLLSPSVGR